MRVRAFLPAALAALLLAASCSSLPGDPPAEPNAEPEVRALWVDSFNPGLRSPDEVTALVERARRANVNTIVAQVRRNAQGLYARSPEGWVEGYVPPTGFDPLQDLVVKAHAQGIEVHAWANIGAVFSGNPTVPTASFPCGVPCDPNHLFNLHGWRNPPLPADEYWLTRTHPAHTAGTSASFLGERTSSGVWFLDLGHPAAADHTLSVLLALLRDYAVDGIHLDYIRYPELPITTPPGGGVSFAIGYNPTSVERFNAAFLRAPGTLPDPWDASFSQWRRDQVRAFVRRLYLEMASVRPQAKLSAALITFFRGPNPVEPRTFQQTEPYYRVFQDWASWMQEGILDMGIPMIYKSQHLDSHATQFQEWTEFTKSAQAQRHGVIGQGAFLNSIENTLVQIGLGRAPSPLTSAKARGFTFFSYHATNAAIPGVPERPRDELFRALAENGAYAAQAPFPKPVPVPAMPWKTGVRSAHLLAQILGRDDRPADGARVVVERIGDGSGAGPLEQFADGNGYVGAVDIPPGAYRLVVQLPGGEESVTLAEPVTAGRVTRVAVRLGRYAHEPFARAERRLGEHERLDRLRGASPLDEWRWREPASEDAGPSRRPPR